MLFLSPLAAWISELPILRARKPWIVAAACLALAAIPVAVVLFLAQYEFAKNMEAQPGGYEDDAY
ncbi:MAG: hypothetical protein HY290_31235 [Planctomycetia bacterium]|nr:hypothetical protein [Planctomycetia bacterium]